MNWKTMYPAHDSKPTQVSGDVSTTAQEIPVVDVTVFPPAPNVATIQRGDEAEVILYQGIDTEGSKLTKCMRGLSDTTAGTWDTGDFCFHSITSDNVNAIIDNLRKVSSPEFLLTPETAALLGVVSDDPTPEEAFKEISMSLSNKQDKLDDWVPFTPTLSTDTDDSIWESSSTRGEYQIDGDMVDCAFNIVVSKDKFDKKDGFIKLNLPLPVLLINDPIPIYANIALNDPYSAPLYLSRDGVILVTLRTAEFSGLRFPHISPESGLEVGGNIRRKWR